MVVGCYLGTHRTGNDVADLRDDIEDTAARLGDERRVRRHAVQQAGFREFADLGQVGGIDEEFHEHASLLLADPSPAVNVADAAPRSEEHTSELQSLMRMSYAAFG